MTPTAPSTLPARPPTGLPELPPMAWHLGHAGLIPFVLGTLLVWLVTPEAHPYVASALAAYAAVIVSFLGGIHWGLVMRMPTDAPPAAAQSALVWGVIPSLVAWMGVMMPPHAGLVVSGAAIVGCYLVDRRRYAAQGVGRWLTLRFRLTGVASLSCFLSAAGS